MKRGELRSLLHLNNGNRIELILTILRQVDPSKDQLLYSILHESKTLLEARLRKCGIDVTGTYLDCLTLAVGNHFPTETIRCDIPDQLFTIRIPGNSKQKKDTRSVNKSSLLTRKYES